MQQEMQKDTGHVLSMNDNDQTDIVIDLIPSLTVLCSESGEQIEFLTGPQACMDF